MFKFNLDDYYINDSVLMNDDSTRLLYKYFLSIPIRSLIDFCCKF